ncbi:response regulator [Tropicibacter sp. R16_0]|uniref:response regulator n=1 Tax=Tropicibacter sp. R16_0 TaxID=2821102 RepID=UPI001AD96041|nr:response regulator [Tropicibacter sp. R16_0]MBO9451300.1 response regulator [Tropicibacter sp. R16_0]
MTTQHLLIVDDHRNIREPLADFLRKYGFRVSQAANGQEALAVLKREEIDLVVLDILMPGESGLDVCRRIRETMNTAVILLTAVSDDTDKIIGLEMGADDYVTKPFNPRELVARIKGVLRRVEALPRAYSRLDAADIHFGDWTLNTNTQTLSHTSNPGETVELSSIEFRLLTTFLRHPKILMSRDQLLDHVSNRTASVFDRSIDNQVSRLRRKIEDDPKKPRYIKTVWGGGYLFSCDVVKP